MKLLFHIFITVWIRATFPRYRYDQFMSLCWIYLLPVTLCMLLFWMVVSFQYILLHSLYRVIYSSLIGIIHFFLLYLILIGSLLILLSMKLFSILYIFRYNPDNEKSILYECGFLPKNDVPIQYEISFYTLGLTFVIFDLELLLIFPFVWEIMNVRTLSF